MLDRDHHIHLIPAERILMLSIEHSAIRKIENERFEIECHLRLSVEGFPHPLEDTIRMTFAAAKIPNQQMMMDITFVQNRIVKSVFDAGLSGESRSDIPGRDESGITISSEIKAQMLASGSLKEVLARNGALADTISFPK